MPLVTQLTRIFNHFLNSKRNFWITEFVWRARHGLNRIGVGLGGRGGHDWIWLLKTAIWRLSSQMRIDLMVRMEFFIYVKPSINLMSLSCSWIRIASTLLGSPLYWERRSYFGRWTWLGYMMYGHIPHHSWDRIDITSSWLQAVQMYLSPFLALQWSSEGLDIDNWNLDYSFSALLIMCHHSWGRIDIMSF